jgi:hypothetical protein
MRNAAKRESVTPEGIERIQVVKAAYEYLKKLDAKFGARTPGQSTLRSVKDSTASGNGIGMSNNSLTAKIEGKDMLDGEVVNERRVAVVLGLTASGKSSALVNRLTKAYKGRILDSDMIKTMADEYENGYGAGFVHNESKDVLTEYGDRPINNFFTPTQQEGVVNGYAWVSNDVPPHTSPSLVDYQRDVDLACEGMQ